MDGIEPSDRRRDSIMMGIVRIVELLALEDSRSGVARNDVKMYMPILILEKGIVEVLGLECTVQHLGGASHLPMQVRPFRWRNEGHHFQVTSQDQEAFPEQVLIAIQDQPPPAAFS